MSQLLEATDVMPNPLDCTVVPLHTFCSHTCTSQACSCECCSVLQADEKPFPQLEMEKIVRGGIGFTSIELLPVLVCCATSCWVSVRKCMTYLAEHQSRPRKQLSAVLCCFLTPKSSYFQTQFASAHFASPHYPL